MGMQVQSGMNNQPSFGMKLKLTRSLASTVFPESLANQFKELKESVSTLQPLKNDIFVDVDQDYNALLPNKTFFKLIISGPLGKSIEKVISPKQYSLKKLLNTSVSMKKAESAAKEISEEYMQQAAHAERVKDLVGKGI